MHVRTLQRASEVIRSLKSRSYLQECSGCAHRFFADSGIKSAFKCWRLYEFPGHPSSVPELDAIITVISHVTSFFYPLSLLQVRFGLAMQVELFVESMTSS